MDKNARDFLARLEGLANQPAPRERMTATLYISGPESDPRAFDQAEHVLRSARFDVFNPARNGLDPAASSEAHMRRNLSALTRCHGVADLGSDPGKISRIEIRIAREIGMPVLPLAFWLSMRRRP